MSTDEKSPEFILDQAITEIRNEEVPPAVIERAADRVWARIAAQPEVETIRGCADYQALIPAYLGGRLPEARALLLTDHTHECPACRKALAAARHTAPVIRMPVRSGWMVGKAGRGWAIAAAILAAIGLAAFVGMDQFAPTPGGSPAVVQNLDGSLYKVAADASTPVAPGAPVAEREVIRTAKGSGAVVRLRDGSLVEMRERTELSLVERSQGATIQLDRGAIIVQAAKQRSRHLYVATEDCTVSVTGTIFSVNRGMKGSRVAVIEGEVQVAQGGNTSLLKAGEQVSTSPGLAPVAVQDEIAWSRNVDSYIALLGELTTLRKKLEAIPGPGLRHSTRLLELAPEGTVLYASIPNLGPTLGEARRLFTEQVQQSEVLRQWWAGKAKAAGNEPQFDEVLNRIRAFSEYLGPEIALAFSAGPGGQYTPLFLAEVSRTGFRAFLEAEIKKLNAAPGIQIVDDPARLAAQRGALLVLLRGNLLAVSTEPAQIQKAAALLDRPGSNSFTKSSFYARIAEAYRGGINWLFCADLETVVARSARSDASQRLGFEDARYLIVERKEVAGKTENRALVTFSEARHGVASWLASPAPMRTLDFITPEASLVTALVVKSPTLLVDDLIGMLGASQLSQFEAASGVNLRADLARPLGGEIAFATDGPLLPQLSWKLVVEVYDPARLEWTIEKMVENINREAQKSGASAARVDKEQSGGRTFYVLRGLLPLAGEAHYTFVGGYLVAAPNRELVLRAIQARETGYSLARSAKFTALLPRDGQANFSGLVYNDLGPVLGPAAKLLGGALNAEQRKALAAAVPSSGPTLVLAYGERDRIQLASTGSLFGLSPEKLLLPGGLGLKRH
jgi:hypothetical protein